MPEPFLANLSRSPSDVAWFSSSQASHPSRDENGMIGNSGLAAMGSPVRGRGSSGRAQDLEVVRVVHDAEDVTERVDHRSGDEPLSRGVSAGAPLAPIDSSLSKVASHVVDVPVQDDAARIGSPLSPARSRGRLSPARAGSRPDETRCTPAAPPPDARSTARCPAAPCTIPLPTPDHPPRSSRS